MHNRWLEIRHVIILGATFKFVDYHCNNIAGTYIDLLRVIKNSVDTYEAGQKHKRLLVGAFSQSLSQICNFSVL